MSSTLPTLAQIAADLEAGRTTSADLVEAGLGRIADPRGEGARAFVAVDGEGARAAAREIDRKRARGETLASRFAGIPISIKDLFDIEGQVTRAGSRVLADAPAAAKDCEAVARLRRAGFILIGRTNMTEFAFSGLGLNPHYGTPRNAWRRAEGAIPGGSSSGAAISVSDGMAHAALGTDTGGSCRIPAAFNTLVGFKPTARRTPRDGAIPLSPTLDSVGPVAPSVACCAALDAILSDTPAPELEAASLSGLRIAAPQRFVLESMDATTARAYGRALSRLAGRGARVEDIALEELLEIPRINSKGGFAAYEAYAWHRALMDQRAALYDPRVLSRIQRGAEQAEADYTELKRMRADWIARVSARLDGFDAFAAPTVPIAPPLLSELEDDAEYGRINLLALRNPSVVNLLDGCSISVPMQQTGEAPAGLMLSVLGGQDHRLLQIAHAAERALAF